MGSFSQEGVLEEGGDRYGDLGRRCVIMQEVLHDVRTKREKYRAKDTKIGMEMARCYSQ